MLIDKNLGGYLKEGTPGYNMFYNYLYDVRVHLSSDKKSIICWFPSFANGIYNDILENVKNESEFLTIQDGLHVYESCIAYFSSISTMYLVGFLKIKYGMILDIKVFEELTKTEDEDKAYIHMESGLVYAISHAIQNEPDFSKILDDIAMLYMNFYSILWSDIENVTSSYCRNKSKSMKIRTTDIGYSYYIPNMKRFMSGD